MAYNPTPWKDRAVDRPRTYSMQDNGDGTFTLTPAPGTIHEQGTPVNAVNLNKIEQRLVAIKQLHQLTTDDGSSVMVGDGTNVNTLTKLGSYFGNYLVNAPLLDTYLHIKVEAGDRGAWLVQKAYHWFSNRQFTRRLINAPTVEWQPWVEIITSEGGTINGLLIIKTATTGNPTLYLEASGVNGWEISVDRSNAGILKFINGAEEFATFNQVQGIMSLKGKEVWHTGKLRTTNGYPEFLIGGVWVPADTNAGLGYQRTYNGSNLDLTAHNGNWVTLVDVQGVRGRIEQAAIEANMDTDYVNGTPPIASCRITVDGVATTDTNSFASDTLDGGNHIWRVSANIDFLRLTSAPIPFFSNFKVEIKIDSLGKNLSSIPRGGVISGVPIIYRLKDGAP